MLLLIERGRITGVVALVNVLEPGLLKFLRSRIEHTLHLESVIARAPADEAAATVVDPVAGLCPEQEAIQETLNMTGGNRKAAAELLQIGERTLYRKIEKYDL